MGSRTVNVLPLPTSLWTEICRGAWGHNPISEHKPRPVPFTAGPGGEERIEDAVDLLRRYALPRIGNRHLDAIRFAATRHDG